MRKIFIVATLIVFFGLPFLKPVLAEDADSGKDVKEGWKQKMEEEKEKQKRKSIQGQMRRQKERSLSTQEKKSWRK